MKVKQELPTNLATEITNGDVVLLFGAGASIMAKKGPVKKVPSTTELTVLLASKFLDEDACEAARERYLTLDRCAEYAIAKSDLVTVQKYIAEEMSGFAPTEAHMTIPKLSWRGLATTNYDCLIEDAYEASKKKARQKVVPFHKNGQPIERCDLGAVPLLKLHGCITRPDDTEIPLILTPDQYVRHRTNRENLFRRMRDWAAESTIVFVGHSGYDSDIRLLLDEICEEVKSRKRFYIVKPGSKDYEVVFWNEKNVEMLNMTFDEFAESAVDLASPFQGLGNMVTQSDAIAAIPATEFRSYAQGTQLFLEHEVDYVNYMQPPRKIPPELFFKGGGERWQGVFYDYDAKRNLTETLLKEQVLDKLDDKGVFISLVASHAGAGKSVLLERTSVELARDFGQPTLYLRPAGVIDSRAIVDFCNKQKCRVFLFVDDAIRNASDIAKLHKVATEANVDLSIFTEARLNEWNAFEHRVKGLTTSEHQLRYLAENEIRKIIAKLEEFGCLFELNDASPDDRFNAFKERAGRQLLVALHEATRAGTFREIVLDEYRKITPLVAQRLYLTVCVFHRLGIPVRAGIINRLYEIPFERFKKEFFQPLEQVVRTVDDVRHNDRAYRSRHRDIADIVFRGALSNVDDRMEFYIGAIKYLNLDFKTDDDAFQRLMSSRAVVEFFPNPKHGEEIYREATEIAPEDPNVWHQRGIYHMNCEQPNLDQAKSDFLEAKERDSSNFRFTHSLAELELRYAERTDNVLKKQKHFAKSRELCADISSGRGASYARNTVLKVAFLELQTLAESSIEDRELELYLERLQDDLDAQLKREPDSEIALQLQARLAIWLNESATAKETLEKAFRKNPRRQFVSKNLIEMARRNGENEVAFDYARKVLDAKPEDPTANYHYGKLAVEFNMLDLDRQEYHFAKSYLDGDANYDARLLHARTLFLLKRFDASRKIFRQLASLKIPFARKISVNYPVSTIRDGRIVDIEATHAWLEDFETGKRIYCHQSRFQDGVWDVIQSHEPVTFTLAFSFMGPCAIEVNRRG